MGCSRSGTDIKFRPLQVSVREKTSSFSPMITSLVSGLIRGTKTGWLHGKVQALSLAYGIVGDAFMFPKDFSGNGYEIAGAGDRVCAFPFDKSSIIVIRYKTDFPGCLFLCATGSPASRLFCGSHP